MQRIEEIRRYNGFDRRHVYIYIKTPIIYNTEMYHDYGVCIETGEIWSKRKGAWNKMYPSISGKSPYPSGRFSTDFGAKFFVQHIAVQETLRPNFPIPPGVTKEEWAVTPASVKRMCRHLFQVNHIDHDHANFHPNNLEWTTAQENVNAYQRFRTK